MLGSYFNNNLIMKFNLKYIKIKDVFILFEQKN